MKNLRFLSEGDARLMAEVSKRRTFKKGETILKEGNVAPGLYILRTGAVRVEMDSRGDSVLVARLEPEEIMGIPSFLDGSPVSASLVADVAKTEVDFLNSVDLQAMLESKPGFAIRFYRSLATILSARLNAAMERLVPPFSG
ncbi:MAG: cyclic nucleotide-binding domain-containing protein [Magnetococcales bacterium]|nr:cyclic nucleotide-binding domain-containing protein [Magnetococcales bacterium]